MTRMIIREWWSKDEIAGEPKDTFSASSGYQNAKQAMSDVGRRFAHRLLHKDERGIWFDCESYVQHVSFMDE